MFKPNINILLSFGHILSFFLMGIYSYSIGWIFLGYYNKKKIWILSGASCLFFSIIFSYFIVSDFLNGRILEDSRFYLSSNFIELISKRPHFLSLLALAISDLIALAFFCYEYNTLFLIVSITFFSSTILLSFFLIGLYSILLAILSNCVVGIAISRIPEEILQGFIPKPSGIA